MSDDKKKTLVLDFDGVIHSYTSGWKGADIIPDPPVPGALRFLLMASARFEVHILSSRSANPNGRRAMQAWLINEFIKADFHNAQEFVLSILKWPTDKPPAHVTIDDRAICFTGEWPSIDSLLEFKPWHYDHNKKENNQK